jgi:HAD superfamily hydrolase (TIGR01509 family)
LRSKPNPDPYLAAFKHLKVSPQQSLIIEDSLTGQEAAFKSGAFWIEAKWYE